MKPSHYIRRRQASYTLPSLLTACEKGVPLNAFITINFRHLGIDEYEAGKLNAQLRTWAGLWLKRPKKNDRYKSTPLTIMWVIENSRDIGVHWALHLPYGAKRKFVADLKIKIDKIYPGLRLSNTVRVDRIYNILGLRKYFLKGMDVKVGELFRVRTSPQGVVYGKRFGVSQNIGPSASAALNIKKRRSRLMAKHFPTANLS